MATDYSIADQAREGGAALLAAAFVETRQRTLGLLDAYAAKLGPELAVPYSTELNPPRWEVGHVAWFNDYWIARNLQRPRGVACDPEHARPQGRLPGADALFNSSTVAHTTRWALPVPDLGATRAYLTASIDEALALLADPTHTPETADDLYFFRLTLFHQDMHAEAACYMAQALGIPLPPPLKPVERLLPEAGDLHVPATTWRLGYDGAGFAFDNELRPHEVELAPFAIDRVPVSWRRFLPAVTAGAVSLPRYLRWADGVWLAWRFGAWEELDLDTAALHLTWAQAQAWCEFAGRRLPSEAEWECAAMRAPLSTAARAPINAAPREPDFSWGDAWEWTADRFAPFAGFVAHPYRDYSGPAFAEHRYVLKGASRATHPRMAHPKYRNYFTPERCDVHTGFRSCAR